MTPRFILVLATAFLFGGALVLWLRPVPVAPPPLAPPAETVPAAPPSDKPPQFLILAASWEPAFCETAPDKSECRSLGANRFDAMHFALHGLWPRDSYCGVSATQEASDKQGRWSQLPPVEIDRPLRAALDEVMPGTLSQLERHEWIKHGTCYGEDVATYYRTAVALMAQLNASPVRELFVANIGKELTVTRIRSAIDRAFGGEAGSRVRLACETDGKRQIITEMTIGMYGAPTTSSDLGQLIRTARPTAAGCDRGIVDAVGAQ